MWSSPRVLYTWALVGLVCAEVLDLGDLSQYKKEGEELPGDLHSDAILIKQDDGGFRVMLGQDVQAKVDGALEGCDNMDNSCFQEIFKALDEAHMQHDRNVESRQAIVAVAAFARIWRTIKRVKEAIAAAVVAFGATQAAGPIFWPEVVASQAGAIPATADFTLSANGKLVGTMTSTPHTTSLEHGNTAPEVTEAPDSDDLVAILDKDLSSRLEEFMQRSQECKIGQDFDKTHGGKRKRAGGSYGRAICAAGAVIEGAAPGAVFNDLLLLNPNGVHFNFAGGMNNVREAAEAYAQFVAAYAPLMAVPDELADQIFNFVFALAIDTIVEGLPLGDKNPIKATSVEKGDATKTKDTDEEEETGECPKRKDLPCGRQNEKCKPKIKEEDGERDVVCADGEHENCKCFGPFQKFVEDRSVAEMQIAFGSLGFERKKLAQCAVDPTDMPLNVFNVEEDGQLKAAKNFCKQWNKDKELNMHSNINGDDRSVTVFKRTPPPNPKAYNDWWVDFNYKPNSNGGKECKKTCDEAYKEIAKSCTSNSGGQYLYENSSLDVSCGTFSLEITEPGPRYNKQWYKGNELRRRKWTCEYTTNPIRGRIFTRQPVCNCQSECEDCGNLGSIVWEDAVGGCKDSTEEDWCSKCRPWEYVCKNKHCADKSWEDCKECHVLFQDQ